MKKGPILILILSILVITLVFAGDFKINFAGEQIFTVATNATVVAQNLSLTGWASVIGNISTSEYFVGDGRFLTNIVLPENGTRLDYHNITGIPTCGARENLFFNGTDLSCTAINITVNSTTISYHNITDIPTCGARENLFFDGTDMSCTAINITVNSTTISYQNITNLPTCGAGEHLDFDGTDLTCTADAGADYTNLAFFNQTNVWAEDQNYSKDINVEGDVVLATSSSTITRKEHEEINISIDDTGNVVINLG